MIASTRFTFKPDRLAALDRQQARAAGRDDVFDDHQRLALAKRPFDELARAVLLRFLANHHAAERHVLACRRASGSPR